MAFAFSSGGGFRVSFTFSRDSSRFLRANDGIGHELLSLTTLSHPFPEMLEELPNLDVFVVAPVVQW